VSTEPSRRRGPAKGTPRPLRMARAEREAQLLDIAEEVLAERGYLATTVEEIAERAGITKPVIYDHFGSKDGLLLRVIVRTHEALEAATRAAFEEMGSTHDAERILRATLTVWFEFVDSHRGGLRLLQEGQMVAQNELERIKVTQAALLVGALQNTDAFGDAEPHGLEALVHAIVGASERYAMWRLFHPHVSAQQAVDELTDFIWNGIRPREG